MAELKISDKSVIKSVGLCGFGSTSNASRVDVKDGRIARIRPLHFDEQYTEKDLNAWQYEKNGKVFKPGMKTYLPAFSIAYKTRTYSPNRVPSPLIREDWDPNGERNPETRGISKYRPISWDEVTGIIAGEIKRIHDKYGPYSIFCQGEGHGEAKVYNGSHGCMINLLFSLGGCTVQARNPDSWEGWYWGAKHIWGMEPMGITNVCNGVFRDITENSDAVLYWGCDPETTPWGWSGQMASRMCYWLKDIDVKSIFICPDVNYAAAVHADKWIPVLPNTDAAFQLAIAHVWLTEGTYDKDYIDTHAVGFDWFESYVLGNIDGVIKTPKWAEEKCGIKSWHIKAFARYWAKKNVSIAHGNGGGFIRSVFSHEPARLEVALLGMQAVGKPGRNQFRYIEWLLYYGRNNSPLPLSETYTSLMNAFNGWMVHGSNLGDSFITKVKLHKAILNGHEDWYGNTLCSTETEDQFVHYGYPIEGAQQIHMIWSDTPCWTTCWNGGFLYEEAVRDKSIEFILIQHPWLENDCLFADIILPAATMMECNDIGNDNFNGQWGLLYLEKPACEPVGEAKSDHHVVVEVAKALEKLGGRYEGIVNKYTGGLTQDEKMHLGFDTCGKPDDLTWEDLEEKEFWMSPTEDGWQDEFAGLKLFYDDPDNFPLQTPTGKIEYYSTRLAEKFPDDMIRAPYPQWIEESDEHHERISSDRAKDYPYLLVSNHPHWRVHAQLDDIPWIREIETCKVKGPDDYLYEPIWIHPTDAIKHGIEHGDIVKIFNERGTVLGGAFVTERIIPGSLLQDHGARVDAIVGGKGGLDRGGANNLIAPENITSPNSAGEVTNGFLVGIEKIDVFELAKQYPNEFGRPYDPAAGLNVMSYVQKGA
jgi:trimethylamine-N-oxide reductase (cytochrome c)